MVRDFGSGGKLVTPGQNSKRMWDKEFSSGRLVSTGQLLINMLVRELGSCGRLVSAAQSLKSRRSRDPGSSGNFDSL